MHGAPRAVMKAAVADNSASSRCNGVTELEQEGNTEEEAHVRHTLESKNVQFFLSWQTSDRLQAELMKLNTGVGTKQSVEAGAHDELETRESKDSTVPDDVHRLLPVKLAANMMSSVRDCNPNSRVRVRGEQSDGSGARTGPRRHP